MMPRAVRIFLEVFGVVVGGLLVIAGIALWRFSSGPVEANFIRPYIEQALGNAESGMTASVAEAKAAWRPFRRVLDVNIRGLQIKGRDGVPVIALQDATLGLSVRGFLFGQILPVELDVHRPEIVTLRDEQGNFSLRIGMGGDVAGAGGDLDSILRQFSAPPNDNDPIGRIRRFHVVQGKVVIDDRKLGVSWTAPNVDIDLTRSASKTAASFTVSLALPQGTARITGSANFVRSEGLTRLSLTIDNFDAAAIAPLSKVLEPLAAAALPVSGKLNMTIDRSNRLVGGDVMLHGTDGKLMLPQYYDTPVAVKSADLAAHFETTPQRLILDTLALDLGGSQVKVNGSATFDGPSIALDVQAAVTDVPVSRFDMLWPHGVALGARDWITANVLNGSIKAANIRWVADGRADSPESFNTKSVTGGFNYEGLEAHYFRPLPPVKAITGHATFDATRMDLTIDSGALGDITVSKGTIGITRYGEDSAIAIDLMIDGPLASVLAVLDNKPLQYIRKLGFDPKDVAGRAKVRTNFAFPLLNSLTFAQVDLGTKGTLDGVMVPDVVGTRDVTDGILQLTLDKKGMKLSGDARLAGVPLSIDWQESFRDADKIRSRIAFRGDTDEAQRTALELNIPPMIQLHGKMPVAGEVTIERGNKINVTMDSELSGADFTVDELGVQKPTGQAGTLHASFNFTDGILRNISDLRVDSSAVKLNGGLALSVDGALLHAELAHVSGPRNDYSLVADAVPGQPERFAVSVKGARFNAAPLLGRPSNPDPKPVRTPRLDITVDLDRVLTDKTHALERVLGDASLSGTRLDHANLQATAGGPLTISYHPAGDTLALVIDAKNAGTALAALSITSGVIGGTLHIDAKTAGGEGPRLTTGVIDMQNFRMVQAPIIARLVNALSLSGFLALLSGQGLAFDRLAGDIDYADNKITFRNGRIAGALGISFEGDVDLMRKLLTLKGTVVPADTINSIIAAIPLIGDIVTGGDRGGLFGWTYTVSGTTEDPRVSVNPLSMFAPGFLRNLFFLGPSEKAPALPPELPAVGASPAAPAAGSAKN